MTFASFVVLFSAVGFAAASVSLGPLSQLDHDVSSGDVMVLNDRQIRILNLKYDGQGPDAFFWIGNATDSKPNPEGTIVPYPVGSDGTKIIPAFNGQNVDLTLPAGKTIKDYTNLSLWCRQYKVDFGHVKIPADLKVPTATKEAPANPPTPIRFGTKTK